MVTLRLFLITLFALTTSSYVHPMEIDTDEDWDLELVDTLASSEEMKALVEVASTQIHQDVETQSFEVKQEIAAVIVKALKGHDKCPPHHKLRHIREEGKAAYIKVTNLAHRLQKLKQADERTNDHSINKGTLKPFKDITHDTIEGLSDDEEDFTQCEDPELKRKLSLKFAQRQ